MIYSLTQFTLQSHNLKLITRLPTSQTPETKMELL